MPLTPLHEDPSRAVIIGAGRGGSAIIEMLLEEELVDIVAVVDVDPEAPGLTLAREHGIDVYDDLAEALKKNAPCVAFNMSGNEMVEAVAADILGAGGVIGGLEARLIWRIVTNLKQARDELHQLAIRDALTGMYNRHYGMEQMRAATSRHQRYRAPFSIVMLDVDHFKTVNDVYGHATGDAVLCEIASVLRRRLRDSDIVCRWGGEEFLVILPDTDHDGACAAAHAWLEAVRQSQLKPAGQSEGEPIRVSFSAGVASISEMAAHEAGAAGGTDADACVERLLHLADERLYHAKRSGRCCIRGSAAEQRQDITASAGGRRQGSIAEG